MKKLLLMGWLGVILSGCATQIQGPNYQSVNPSFDLFAFFDGSVKAWGIVQNRSGELVQRFEVDIDGRVEGNRLILDEIFEYGIGDGAKQRTWIIEKLPNGGYRGFAHDVLDEASGESFGNAFHWSYGMEIPVGQRTIEVQFEDWFWALDDSRILSRSYLQKFGFDVAEVTLFMERNEFVTDQ